MSKLDELLAQQEALQEEINQAKKNEKNDALKEVRRLCKLHGFTHNQLKGYLAAGRQRKSSKAE